MGFIADHARSMGFVGNQVIENFKNKIEYPQEFIDKCLSVYPDDEDVKQLIEDKSFLLGRYLRQHVPALITKKELIEASKNGTMEELNKRGEEIKIKRGLADDFDRLYEDQYLRKDLHINRFGIVGKDSNHITSYRCKLRHGEVELAKFKIDRVAERKGQEGLRLTLEQNAERRRVGEEIAKDMWCGGAGA